MNKIIYILLYVLLFIGCKTPSYTHEILMKPDYDIIIELSGEIFWFDLGKFIIKKDYVHVYKMEVELVGKRLNTKYFLDTTIQIDYMRENMLNIQNQILLIDSTCHRSTNIIGYEESFSITVKEGKKGVKRTFFNYLPTRLSGLFYEINKNLHDRELKYWLQNIKDCK